MKNSELRELITDRMIDALKRGVKPWVMPWTGNPNAGHPTNAKTGARYRGINPLMLQITAQDNGYENKHWATFKQWRALKAGVKLNEKGTLIVFWKKTVRKVRDDSGELKTENMFLLRYSHLFNISQVERYDVKPGKRHPLDRLEIPKTDIVEFTHDEFAPAESLIDSSGADISHGGGKAFYRPSDDSVHLPEKSRFPLLADYYSTAFHELSHWAERRTGLTGDSSKQDRSYGFCELVAELGACYVCQSIGVPVTDKLADDDQHAAYLAGWLKSMDNDSKFIFDAAKWASKAADLLLGDEVKQEPEAVSA